MKNPINVPFLKYIYNMTHFYNNNWLQVTTGNPGAGKSYSNLTIAEILDKKFSIDRVCFDAKEFLDMIDSIKYNGAVGIIDEIGIALSSRKWASLSNILTNEVIQTFRFKHMISLFVVPDFSYIDSQARKIIDCFCEAKRYMREPTKLWCYTLSHDRKKGKMYFPHPVVKVDNTRYSIRHLTFKRKPAMIKEYEEKAAYYKDKLRKKNKRMLEMMEARDTSPHDTMYDMINKVAQNKQEYVNIKSGALDPYIIMGKFRISRDKANQIKRMIETEEKTSSSSGNTSVSTPHKA